MPFIFSMPINFCHFHLKQIKTYFVRYKLVLNLNRIGIKFKEMCSIIKILSVSSFLFIYVFLKQKSKQFVETDKGHLTEKILFFLSFLYCLGRWILGDTPTVATSYPWVIFPKIPRVCLKPQIIHNSIYTMLFL